MTAMLFDLHGVLLHQPTEEDQRRLERLLGVDDPQVFRHVLREMAGNLDVGDVSERGWWNQVAPHATAGEIDSSAAFDAACAGCMRTDTEAVSEVLHLIDAGYPCGVLANVSVGLAVRMRRDLPWLEDFDAVAFSCDIGLPATDPEAFAVAVEAMEASARETIYVSACPGNVAAAESIGLQGLLYGGVATLRGLCEKLSG